MTTGVPAPQGFAMSLPGMGDCRHSGRQWLRSLAWAIRAAALLLVFPAIGAAQPSPVVTLTNVPTEAVIGENFTFTATLDNASPTAPGYGPLLDVILPATGVDGAGNATDDGISFVSASYAGLPVNTTVLTFNASGQATHPYARNATGAPLIVTGTPGNQLVAMQLPFAALTPEQPAVDVVITAAVSPLADSNAPLAISARGGFQFGADAVDNPTADPTIFGALVSATVTPTVLRLAKFYLGDESETVTGPNFPIQYRIDVDIADGQTITDLDVTDILPTNLQFIAVESTTIGGAATTTIEVSTPSTTTPGGTLTRRFASVTGTTRTSDASVVFSAYVPRTDGTVDVLDPATGTGPPAVDDVSAVGTWLPVDTRDPPGPVTSDLTPADHTLTVKALAAQKSVAVAAETGPVGPSPGDLLTYTLEIQVSDFFALQNLVVTDELGDGLARNPAVAPSLTVVEHGVTNGPGAMSVANFSFVKNSPGTGTTTATFRISDELVARGLDGQVLGGCVPAGGTGSAPPDCTVSNNGPTTIRLTYPVIIVRHYTDAPGTDTAVDGGDVLNNAVSVTGDLLSAETLTPTGSPAADTSGESVTIVFGEAIKTIYAVNGNTTVPSPLVLVPGDTITYRLRFSLPTSSTEELNVTDYLPFPILDATTITVFNPTVSATPPPAGQASFGPDDTFPPDAPIVPTMTTNAAANSVSFAYPPYDQLLVPSSTIDLLITGTATTVPAADGLAVTNIVQVTEATSGDAVLEFDSVVQITLNQPNVGVRKGVVATNATTPAFSPSPVGPVSFSAPGSAGYRGSGPITSAGLTTRPINSNLSGVDAGDLVTFAIVLENTGHSSKGAFDVRVRDTLPPGFAIPSAGAGLNLQVTNGAGTPIPFISLGAGLFDPAGGLELTDSTSGSLGALDPASGTNIAVVTFDLEVAAAIQPAQVATNTATLFNFAGAEGAQDHTGTDRTDTATVTALRPTVLKNVLTTNQPHTTGNNVVIGERVQYEVVVQVPEGVANAVTLVDTLPVGLAIVSLDGITASPDLTTTGGGGSFTGVLAAAIISPGGAGADAGRIATLSFGTLTNSNRDNAIAETIVIQLTAVVVNGGGNNRGATRINSAAISFTGGSVTRNAPAVTIAEPTLQIVKTAAPATADAGDTVTFSVTLTHAPGSNADAFEVSMADVVPAGLTFVAITATTGLAPTITPGGGFTATWATFPVGATSTIEFTATVNAGITPGQVLTNTATSQWTSLPGAVLTPQSTFNTLSTERTGNPANPGGAENDYVTTGTATVTGRTFSASKTIVSTNLLSTTGNTVVVGERIRYEVQVVVPEVTERVATMVDTLDPGLAFLSFDSITASPQLTTTVPGGFPAVFANRVVSNVDGGAENDGRRVTFDAGTMINTDTDNTTVEKITLVYTAVVLNTAGNVRGITRNNEVTQTLVPVSPTLAGPDVVIAEPTLQVAKAAAPDLADAGDEITVTLTVSHAAGSNADAYDVSLVDAVPAGMTYVPGSLVHVSGAFPIALTTSGATLSATYAHFVQAETSVLEFKATLDSGATPVTPGQVVTNTANLTWTSLPGVVVTPQSPLNTFSTERTGIPTDVGGAANTYSASATDAVTVASSQISGFVYIDVNRDGIRSPGEPGLGGVVVALLGTDHLGGDVFLITNTTADGSYVFTNLRPGTYRLVEVQPPGYADGPETVGTPELGATAGNDIFAPLTLPAAANTTATDFNFAEEPTADLSLVKSDSPDPVLPGGTLTYTVQVTNSGPNPAVNAVFTDPVPGGTTFLSMAAPAGWTCDTPPVGSGGTITCSTPQFAPGTVPFTLAVTVNLDVPPRSELANVATITSSSIDTNPGNNRDREPTIVAAPGDADLEVVKTDSPDPVLVGNNVTYTVTVRNNGPEVTDATVTDTLPAGLTFVSAATSAGSCTTAAPISCTIPGMAVGTTATITVVATATVSGVHTNVVTVAGTAPDPKPANDRDEEPTTVVAAGEADVAVVKTGPMTAARGGNMTYRIEVTNNGLAPAVGVSLTDSLPQPGVIFLSNTGDCTTAFPCALGTLAPGETRVIVSSFAVLPSYAGPNPLLNRATVSSTTPDSNLANNTSDVLTLIGDAGSADLAITKSDSPDAVVAGTSLLYTLVVTNNGPGPAIDVVVTDFLPGQVTVESITTSRGLCTGAGPVECQLGTIDSGANATIAITVLVDSAFPAPGSILNTAEVTSTSDDANLLNNLVVEPTTVVAQADLQVVKTAPDVVVAGTNLVYTVTVSNFGPSAAAGVVLSDPTPAGLVFVSNAGDCATAFPCALGTILLGETRTITSTFLVPSSYVAPPIITNTATVAATTADPVPANNTSTVNTLLVREADLSIFKTGPATTAAGENVTYQITITNAGPSDAIDVQVSDPVPPGLTWQVNAGDCATAFPCTFATLPIGQSRTFTATFRLDSGYTAPDPVVNIATVGSATPDPRLIDNISTALTPLGAPSADIVVTKSGPALAVPGTNVTYTITVFNAGPADAAEVTLADPTPSNLTFVETTGDCTTAFPCAFGTMVAGAVRTVFVTYLVPPEYTVPDQITNIATATTATMDRNLANNTATAVTSVGADVAVTKTLAVTTSPPGGKATYTLTVTNNGPSPAQDVVLEDPTPTGLEFVSNTGDCETAYPCALGTMQPGDVLTITSTYDVSTTLAAGTTIPNTATVASTTFDLDTSNNTATATLTISPSVLYFAEGASGRGFFEARFDVFNPSPTATATVTLRYLLQNGQPCPTASCVVEWELPPLGHRSTLASDTIGPGPISFSAVVESNVLIAAERTMTWDDVTRYGSHMESGVPAPATTWYVAEGATHSDFDLWYLLQNPTDTATEVEVTFLRPAPAAAETRVYSVPPQSRVTLWVNEVPGFEATDVSAVFRSLSDVPIYVEHAMYKTVNGIYWSAGGEGAAVQAPSTAWHFAEGATGDLFDTYLLLSNPATQAATVNVVYRLPNGTTVEKPYVVEAQSRRTVYTDIEDPLLANTALSMSVYSDVPLVAERSMWWPGPAVETWYEGHLVAGSTRTGTIWSLASGEQGGDGSAATYVLVGNAGTAPGEIRMTLYLDDGTALVKTFATPPSCRLTVDIGQVPEFAAVAGQRFGVLVESLGDTPSPLIVEAAIYTSSDGVQWSAGRAALATRIK